MLSFIVKKMLPAVAQHAAQEYEADKTKVYHGEKRSAKMRDGFESEYLFFPAKRENAPLLIDFYGGGYIGGNVYKEIELCERYRGTLDVNVAALSYRYGPVCKHPQSLQDAYDGFSALMDDSTLDFDRSKVVIEGHSAGAHLVCSLALYNQAQRQLPICGLLLDYPLFDLRKKSLDKLPKLKYALNPMIMEMMYHGYVKDERAASDPYASPILASDEQLRALPKLYINTCENDSLKFSAKAFCERLDRLGIVYTAYEEKGAVHGYVEQCANDTMKTLNDYPKDMNAAQYALYNAAFERFCGYMRQLTGC